jgi:hypothetical protein
MIDAIPIVEEFASTVNILSERTSGRIKHDPGMSRNLRASKASKQAGVSVTFSGWDIYSKSVNGALRLLK